MFIEAADRWWIKQQKDKVAPTTWEGFKSQFKKHFLPPDEESRAWDAYRNLRQRNLSVSEYGLNDRIKMEVQAKYVTTLDESIAVALNYEAARGRPSGFVQAGPHLEYTRRGVFQRKWIAKTNESQPSGQPKQGKPAEKSKKTSTTVGAKRKVTPMAARGWSKSSLNPEQREKARKEGLCFGCLQKHQWKDCPLNKDRRTAAMIIYECDTEMQECPSAEQMQMQFE